MPPPIRTWFLTYPKCSDTKEALLEHLESIDTVVEYIICHELHKDGDPHLHAYVKFLEGVKHVDAPTKFDYSKHGNYQAVRSAKKVIQYVKKDGDYISSFDVTRYLNKGGKVNVDLIRSKTMEEALTDGDISYTTARNYQYVRTALTKAYAADDVRGIWIYGPPGVGKSHLARERGDLLGGYYLKAQNKWWDGYEGEPVVILDDFDEGGVCLKHYLKIWADKYAARGEIKGATTGLAHREFIITSNYSIGQIFQDTDSVTVEAITRRFRVIEIPSRTQYPDVKTLKRDVDQYLTGVKREPERVRPSVVGSNRMTFTEGDVYGKK